MRHGGGDKICVGAAEEGRTDADSGESGNDPDPVKLRWRKLWAFAVSKQGLGLESRAFWALTFPEFKALRDVWKREKKEQLNILAVLRADLFNSNGAQRVDGQQWLPEHFGGDPAPKKDPRVKWNREALKTRIKTVFGEDGRAFVKPKKGEKKVRVIDTLKGQPLPRKLG